MTKAFKAIAVALLLALTTGCAAVKSEQAGEARSHVAISQDLTYIELLPDTYVVSDETFHQSNVLVARMDAKTVLLASSPFEDQGAEQLMRWIRRKFGDVRVIAVNTHFHSDGTGGNAVYHQHGVETWASEQTRQLHSQRAEYYRHFEAEGFPETSIQRERILARTFAPAKQAFPQSEGKIFSFAQETAEVFYPGPAHSPDNVVVYLPKRKVLFGGCMIKLGATLGYLGDADVPAWAASATALKRFEVKYLIPGHGHQMSDASGIEHTIALARQAQQK
ncbi:MAG: SPM family subclass B1 metallo-beta-lactamase [Candidatus Melainabacteria bacterium HGW-Melainabacteria-1]|nr:MAG: SPM family subclass B1 metallo-beta-lactamase [Candidatus Melainabacteria bacterium HGW-Melainabacteria-1]